MNAPRKTCPWRRDQPTDGSLIPRFDFAKMEALVCTVGNEDAFFKIMSCHGSKENAPMQCIGYIYREGHRNLNVRLMAARREINFKAIDDACEDLDLWPSFEKMLAAYRRGCKPKKEVLCPKD